MLQLAHEHASGEPVQVRRIAERHGIPLSFLVQILHDLKRAGLATSVRGAAGGYRLSRSPGELTLADVVEVFEPLETSAECAAAQSPLAPAMSDVCSELARARSEQLRSLTLAELADRAATHADSMWSI